MPIAVKDVKPSGSSSGLVPMSQLTGSRINVADAAAEFNQNLTIDDRLWMLADMEKDGRAPVADDLQNQSLFFARSLEYLKAAAFDVEYEMLPYRDMFPVVNEGGPGIKEIVAEVYDSFGKAKLINKGAHDVPMVDAGGREVRYNVGLFGIGAEWNMQELHAHQAAVRNGRGRRSPQQSRQAAAIRGIDEAVNEQVFFGTPEIGVPGFIDHPNIPKGTVAPGASTETTWDNKTADEILNDIDSLATDVWVDSKMIERPNTLALPPSKMALISQRRLDNRDISILTYLKENSLFFNNDNSFIAVNEYEGAGVGGTGLMTAYDKNERKVAVEIPQEMQTLPVQQQLFNYIMLYYTYSAGCVVYYPRSVAHAEGI